MTIFNSYVKLPEGRLCSSDTEVCWMGLYLPHSMKPWPLHDAACRTPGRNLSCAGKSSDGDLKILEFPRVFHMK